jgi:hypothetical protein
VTEVVTNQTQTQTTLGKGAAAGAASAAAGAVATFAEHRARLDAEASAEGQGGEQGRAQWRGAPLPASGGQSYACGTGRAATAWCNDVAVREAIHMKPESFYGRAWSLQAGAGMRYTTYTGSSYDLYPVRCLPSHRSLETLDS